MMADAPAHQLFVLLGPVDKASGALPAILCALHVCLEGAITADSVRAQQAHGQVVSDATSLRRLIAAVCVDRIKSSAGDLIPWTLANHFQDENVAALSGVRIIRIATAVRLVGVFFISMHC